jgi:AcrR family transcriptional regulator
MPPHEKPAMKERILETADRLFYLRGIRAVGVDTIAAEIGISKRTLYNHFQDEFIAAYLQRRSRAPASDAGRTDSGTFDRLSAASRPGFLGCLFVNAVAELVPRIAGQEDRIAAKAGLVSGVAAARCRRRRRPDPTDALVDGRRRPVRDDPRMRARAEA